MSQDSSSAATRCALPPDCEKTNLGVAFFDLARFASWSDSEQDELIAGFLQQFYGLSARLLEGAGAQIVKFIGDGGLAVFPPASAETVVAGLDRLAEDARELAGQCGLNTYLNINVHVGPVLAGSFGPPGQERFDVIGKTVNVAARLGRRGMTLSPQAFRCLSAESRKQFQKNMPPITYRRATG